MRRLQNLTDPDLHAAVRNGCVLTVGNFDGVHRGHQQILKTLIEKSRALSVPAAVLTFEPHPSALLSPGRLPPRLTSADDKAELLSQFGVDVLVEYPTDWELLKLEPIDFFEKIVRTRLNAKALVEGPNFLFGAKRAGNVQVLNDFCKNAGMQLTIVEPHRRETDDRMVSSTEIRAALLAGDVATAASWLGRPYSISGRIVTGEKRGRTIGFPTANLSEIETLVPSEGVYAAQTWIGGRKLPVALNIGSNPTFSESQLKVEAHIIGFSGDLYDQNFTFEFLSRIRGLVKFESVEALQRQINEDVAQVLRLAGPVTLSS